MFIQNSIEKIRVLNIMNHCIQSQHITLDGSSLLVVEMCTAGPTYCVSTLINTLTVAEYSPAYWWP